MAREPELVSRFSTQREPLVPETLPGMAEEERDGRLQALAVAFAVGLPLLAVLWVLTEYYEERTWPSRFASDPDVAGTWDPWLFFVAGIWLIIVVVHALRTYFGPPIGPIGRYIRRPIAPAELDRELDRMRSRRP